MLATVLLADHKRCGMAGLVPLLKFVVPSEKEKK
jgi:hypothetical protein